VSTTHTASNNYTITVPNGSGGTYFSEPVTIKTLYPNFDKWAIGFKPLLNTFENLAGRSKMISYPPYNLYRNGDINTIEIAVAGYTRENLTVTLDEDNVLTIEGDKIEVSDDDTVYQGISARHFRQEFLLSANSKVTSAELSGGLLLIFVYAETPENNKVKQIKIT